MPRIRDVVFTFEDTLLEGRTPDESLERHTPAAGASAALATCFGRYRLGLISTTQEISASDVRDVLHAMDWSGWFESVATPADLGYDCENPNMFRATASSMGIQPGMVAAVGSARQASLAANRAGCRPVHVGTALSKHPVERRDRPIHSAPLIGDVPRVLAELTELETAT